MHLRAPHTTIHSWRRGRLPLLATTALVATSALVTALAAPVALGATPSSGTGPASASAIPTSPRTTAAWPAAQPSGQPAPTAAPTTQVVTLVTGDQVRITHRDDGRTTASLLPGSPSEGRPVHTVTTPDGIYVEPKMPVSERVRLDTSVFNITRLAQLSEGGAGVPLVVTFAKGTQAHDLPGITVAAATATSLPSGQTRVAASYSPDSAGLTLKSAQLTGVVSVALPPQRVAPPGKKYVLHTLTVRVLDDKGKPARFAEAWVQNVDNGGLSLAPILVLRGEGKVSVPEGHYSVIAGGFSNWLVVAPEFTVAADRTVSLDARDATSRPSSTMAGTKPLEAEVTLVRTSQRRGSFSWSFGSSRFNVVLTPVVRDVTHGSLNSLVSATLVPDDARTGYDDIQRKLIFTKDARSGVPRRFTVRHHKSDFAVVRHRNFSNGPARNGFSFTFAFSPLEHFAFVFGMSTALPSRQTLWLQGSDDLVWLQGVEAYFAFRPFSFGEMDAPVRSYDAGTTQTLPYFRGPVGPGLERGSTATGRGCGLCRSGNKLTGTLPLWSSAGTGMLGFTYPATDKAAVWSLSSRGGTVQSGRYFVTPDVTLPAGSRRYTLNATVAPKFSGWRLSTRVTDSWKFTSERETAAVPLLMPRYVPTDNLRGYLRPGRTSFRLGFDHLGSAQTRVTKAKVRLSVDSGTTWDKARLTRTGGTSFRVAYANPAPKPSQAHVSLQVSAKDAKGRSVRETALDVYRLTKPSSGPKARPASASTRSSGTDGATPSEHPRLNRHGNACAITTERIYRCFSTVQASGDEAVTKSGDPTGWTAIDLRDAYGLDDLTGADQTVAVTVAYDYPSAESDLATYRRTFGLPACRSKTGCFTKINQKGETANYPFRDQGWALEAALDLQMISAACPTCKLILAEANQPTDRALGKTIDSAVAAGADVTNHSYGIQEYNGITRANPHYSADGSTSVAASGDFGYQPATFPASSPDVVSVGGTVLRHASNHRGWKERAWRYGGSGCSAYFDKPAFQRDPACPMRTFADLSAVSLGLAVYDSFVPKRFRGWLEVGGTSASSPFVAGLVAAAGAGGLEPGALYDEPRAYHDVARGGNGAFQTCRTSYLCNAKPGYDAPTGWGTPRALRPFTTHR